MKRPYWMQLIVRKESLNCVTQFYNHLWLIQGLVCLAFKNYWLLNLELAEVQTGHIFNIIFWGTKLISELVRFESKLCFYWPTKVEVPFSKKMKLFLVKGFCLNFVKKFKGTFTLYGLWNDVVCLLG